MNATQTLSNDQPVENLEIIPIRITNPAGNATPGKLAVQRWEGKIKFKRAVKLCAKILGFVMIPVVLCPFVHVLIIPGITLLTLTLIAMPYIFSRFMDQTMTFQYAEGTCPHCGAEGRLNRYLQISVSESFTLICPKCGQTCKGEMPQKSA